MAIINAKIEKMIIDAQEDLISKLIATIFTFQKEYHDNFKDIENQTLEMAFGDFREFDNWVVMADGYREKSLGDWNKWWDKLEGPMSDQNINRLNCELTGRLMSVCQDFHERWQGKFNKLSKQDLADLHKCTNIGYGSADDYSFLHWVEALVVSQAIALETVVMHPLLHQS